MTPSQLKQRRHRNNLTQAQMSAELCISKSQYCKWEWGSEPVPELVEKYLNLLDSYKEVAT